MVYLDLNKTPQSKPRTRKHRAKVVKEDIPKRIIRKVTAEAVRSEVAAQSAVKIRRTLNFESGNNRVIVCGLPVIGSTRKQPSIEQEGNLIGVIPFPNLQKEEK